VTVDDRLTGRLAENPGRAVGDMVIRRSDGLYAYQLAVVVDDALQGVTHVVRGEDLADNTARQLLLGAALGCAAPRYLHTPLVTASNGEKLSKQNGARPIDITSPLRTLVGAASVLGLPAHDGPVAQALAAWSRQWRDRFP